MRHDWIYDVLNDLRQYAEKNGLTAIAAETKVMIDVARKELTEKTRAEQSPRAEISPAPPEIAAQKARKLPE